MTAQKLTLRRKTATKRTTVQTREPGERGWVQTERNIHKISPTPEAEKRNPALRYLASLAPSGRRSQRWALTEMATEWKRRPVKDCCRLAWHRITVDAIDRIRTVLAAKFAAVTANRCLAALRRTLKECWRAGQLTHEQFQRLADFPAVRGETLPGKAVRRDQVEKLLAVCERDNSPAGARDGAALVLMYAAGLRRAEVAALDVDDLLPEGEIAVAGKGGMLGMASLGTGAPWVARWLVLRGPEPGRLLWHVRPSGEIVPEGLCGAAVGAIVTRRAEQAGLDRISAHMLRRGFATELLRRGHDHLLVGRALRHKDVRSVKAYDGRSDLERALAIRAAFTVPEPRS